MDSRVAAFLEELGAQETIEPLPVRDRIVSLLDQVTEEHDRVALLQAFHAVMGLAVRSLESQGNDATKLKDAILSDRRFSPYKKPPWTVRTSIRLPCIVWLRGRLKQAEWSLIALASLRSPEPRF
ncbi:hypothetical protein AV944_17470 (plasmid) [Sphingomonas sp. LK11]|jgi:hypothetical protein|nr:hypothetical protein AV944_17470 [Sphingomonas sp. LK11]